MAGTVPQTVLPRLAFADLWHEWILSLCVATALAAVMAPLLLLLGLKHGTIETMRDRLIQDPAYRSIRPGKTEILTEEWFRQAGQRPEVGFIVPTVLRGASVVRVSKPDSRNGTSLDMLPTAAGDPLLIENGVTVPGAGEAVLTAGAARQLGIAAGQPVSVRVNRFGESGEENVDTLLKLSGVLASRGDPLPRIYLPLSFTRDVETFRSGQAVPERGWTGGIRAAAPAYDGVYILSRGPLDIRLKPRLTAGTGFSVLDPDPIDRSAFQDATGQQIGSDWVIYNLHVVNDPSNADGVETVGERLRGQDAVLVPYVRPFPITSPNGGTLSVASWSISQADAARLGISPPPWEAPRQDAPFARLGSILLPGAPGSGGTFALRSPQLMGDLAIPLTISGAAPGSVALIPSALAGLLRTGMRREIVFDQTVQRLVLGKTAYSGFRMFAKTIDDVAPLAEALAQQGFEVVSEAQSIERIRILDRGLTRMFWLVAAVGIVGGVAALVSSLYAAVQRKRRELGMMRLLGLPRAQVFLFPIYQSTALAGTAALLSLLGFAILAAIINRAFASDLDLGQSLCWLPASYLVVAVAGMPVAASLCALLAGSRATRVDPAEAIRDE